MVYQKRHTKKLFFSSHFSILIDILKLKNKHSLLFVIDIERVNELTFFKLRRLQEET